MQEKKKKKRRRKDIYQDLCDSKDHGFVPCGPTRHHKMAHLAGELFLFILGNRKKGYS